MKVLILIVLFVVNSSVYADSNIVVRFINGVSLKNKCSDRSCAEQNTEALRSILQKRFGSDLDIELSYNKNEKNLKDGLEVIIQASKSDAGLRKLSDLFHGNISPELYDRFLKERERRYSAELWEHAFKQKMFADILEEQAKSQFRTANSTPSVTVKDRAVSIPKSLKRLFDDFAVEFYTSAVSHIPDYENSTEYRNYKEILREHGRLLASGKGVVIVCHSQGCFFANKIAKELNSPYLKIVAVGTPASYVYGGGEYITLEEDTVINRTVKIAKFGTVLDSNISNGKRYANGHSFTEDYLTGENSRRRIVELVGKAMNEIEKAQKDTLLQQVLTASPKTRKEKERICYSKGFFISYAGDELKKRLADGWIWWSSPDAENRKLLIKPPSQNQCDEMHSRFGRSPSIGAGLYDGDGCRHFVLLNPLKKLKITKSLCGE